MAGSKRDVRLPKEIAGREVVSGGDTSNSIFKVVPVRGQQNARDTDSEFRILEDVAKSLGATRGKTYKDVTGTIRLFSERVSCESCEGVLDQFQTMYPNIRIQWATGPWTLKETQ